MEINRLLYLTVLLFKCENKEILLDMHQLEILSHLDFLQNIYGAGYDPVERQMNPVYIKKNSKQIRKSLLIILNKMLQNIWE